MDKITDMAVPTDAELQAKAAAKERKGFVSKLLGRFIPHRTEGQTGVSLEPTYPTSIGKATPTDLKIKEKAESQTGGGEAKG